MPTNDRDPAPPPLRRAAVLRADEDGCQVWDGQRVQDVAFAPVFPTPRAGRVLPGHLVAVATAPDGRDLVVWRWFDAVVLGPSDAGRLRLWEPGHGEVVAQLRNPTQRAEPGSRVYASAGLPGADWWAAGPAATSPQDADVELDAVDTLYRDQGLWGSVFG